MTDSINTFKEMAQELLQELENHIETMPHKGDACHESQKVCIMVAISDVYSNINGISEDDLIPID